MAQVLHDPFALSEAVRRLFVGVELSEAAVRPTLVTSRWRKAASMAAAWAACGAAKVCSSIVTGAVKPSADLPLR